MVGHLRDPSFLSNMFIVYLGNRFYAVHIHGCLNGSCTRAKVEIDQMSKVQSRPF